jgi:hypothetical protein
MDGTTTINGTLDINSSLFFFASTTGTKTFVGKVTIASGATWSNTVNEDITFQGGFQNDGTFAAGSGIYSFNTNDQDISGSGSITFVTLSVCNGR